MKKTYRCVKCGATPDLHNIRDGVIRVYDAKNGRWKSYPQHGFVFGGGGENVEVIR